MAVKGRNPAVRSDSVVDSIVTLFTGITSGLVIYLLVRDNVVWVSEMAYARSRLSNASTLVKTAARMSERVPLAAIAGLVPVFAALHATGILRRAVRGWLLTGDRVTKADFIATLRHYRTDAGALVEWRKAQMNKLPPVHRAQARAVGYEQRLDAWSGLVETNAAFLDRLADFLSSHWGVTAQEVRLAEPTGNVDRAVDVLGHFARDWSSDSNDARRSVYGYVTSLLQKHADAGAQVVVPGAGFCKLAYDISRLGMKTTAVDYSVQMDAGAQFALYSGLTPTKAVSTGGPSGDQAAAGPSTPAKAGRTSPSKTPSRPAIASSSPTKAKTNGSQGNGNGNDSPKKVSFDAPPSPTKSKSPPTTLEIAPFMHEFSHQVSGKDQLRTVPIDLFPETAPENLTLHYGDFRALARSRPHAYDAVVTVYFIDTAENVFSYLDAIEGLLKEDGVWINYGPLKWGTAPLAEPTLMETVDIAKLRGWQLIEKFQGEDHYTGDPKSMWKAKYQIRGWVAKRTKPTAQS